MQKQINAVTTFHNSFGIENKLEPTSRDWEVGYLRYKLMQEENDEYLDAVREGNIVEIADALGDQLYILCGTLLVHGLQHKIEEIFDEIQRSNMSKLDRHGRPIINGESVIDDSKPMGKILKGPDYFKPNILKVLFDK